MSPSPQHSLAVDEKARMENEANLRNAVGWAELYMGHAEQADRDNDPDRSHQNSVAVAWWRAQAEGNSREQDAERVEASPAAAETAPEREGPSELDVPPICNQAAETAPEREGPAELDVPPICNQAAEDAARAERVRRAREVLQAASQDPLAFVDERLAFINERLAVFEREFAAGRERHAARESQRVRNYEGPATSQELLTAVINKRFTDIKTELGVINISLAAERQRCAARESQGVRTREDLAYSQELVAVINERLDVVDRELAVAERDIAVFERGLAVVERERAAVERERAAQRGRPATRESQRDRIQQAAAADRQRRAAIVRERARADQAWAAAGAEQQRREAELVASQKRTLRYLLRVASSADMFAEYFHLAEREWYEFHAENLVVPDVGWWGRDQVAIGEVRQHVHLEMTEMFAINHHVEELARLRAEGDRLDLERWQVSELHRHYTELARLRDM